MTKYKKPSQAQSIKEIDPEYIRKAVDQIRARSPGAQNQNQNVPLDDSPEMMRHILEVAHNIEREENRMALDEKRRQADYERMIQVEKQQREETKRRIAAAVRFESAPVLEQLDGLERSLQGHLTEEKICQFCHNLNHYNHPFVSKALDNIRNIRRKYRSDTLQNK
jgi:hypothetical protein